MIKTRFFSVFIFVAALTVALLSIPIRIELTIFYKALVIYLLFSCLYHHLRVINKTGSATIDYGMSYSLSFGMIAGPFGVFIFETIYRSVVFIHKKWTNTDEPDELYHTFYNIGAFVIFNTIAYFTFSALHSYFELIPFGFWILIIMIVIIVAILSDSFLLLIFSFLGDINTKEDIINFLKQRNLLALGTTAFSNGLLYIFLLEEQWEMLIGLFILNYLVSRSFVSKAQSIQTKVERDQFEQMAYTDFLTGIHNRAYMAKKMSELNNSGEHLGIVLVDIDHFKKINDTYNHDVGDQVIQHFTSLLRKYLHDEDCLFRSGGEEFTIFLRKRTYTETLQLIEYIGSEVEKNSANVDYNGENVSISYTASFGLFYYKITNEVTMGRGHILADHLLLESKRQGRNTVTAINDSEKNIRKGE